MASEAKDPREAVLEAERWRPVAGFPYSVSDAGRVRNDRTGYILAPRGHSGGYIRASLCLDGHQEYVFVHHLVLEAFVGARPDGMECNHKNGIKTDNRMENLEWVSHQDNMRHAVENGLYDPKGDSNGRNTLTPNQVTSILARLPDAGDPLPFRLAEELAAYGGTVPSNIYRIHAGQSWVHLQEDRLTRIRAITPEGGQHP